MREIYSLSPAWVSTRRVEVDVRVAFCGELIDSSASFSTRPSVDGFALVGLWKKNIIQWKQGIEDITN